ncbi:hypothetical protein WSO01_04280 [Weissella soli]|nr:hypothetical protein WSO01_04280 [Weissella soli]
MTTSVLYIGYNIISMLRLHKSKQKNSITAPIIIRTISKKATPLSRGSFEAEARYHRDWNFV